MILLIKLIFAHILGDFFFQPDKWVAAKEERKLGAYQFYLHLLIHAALTLILLWDLSFWPYMLIIVISHGILDAVKIYFQNEKTKRTWFFADQAGHLLVIIGVAYWIAGAGWIPWHTLGLGFWTFLTIAAFLTIPSAIIIRTVMSKWTPFTNVAESDSLAEAGKYIGILERLFAFAFIISGRWEAIGFLVAAKSVFRFGDLRQSKDRKLTEYILIGTLLSFGISILCGLIYTVITQA
ncbi:DUF3307 domain-containing protein [Lunatibacter salilacus]|uniref:DUF3307 domain-containing protein n=1 Tax=Lunatibacter salilacus TaxID=2483804 RepID=UPI00131DFA7C|nr:DUF3307 domain-containing protein [Lunatibacter salilacus]